MFMDTLTGLRVFVAVADLRSFVAASSRLGISPAMASKHVRHIEGRVGGRLLNRNSRSVSLTEAGAQYLARVRALLDGLAEAEANVTRMASNPQGLLRVSLPIWMANPDFARMVAAFRSKYPQVVLELDLSGRQVSLAEEGFDLALRVSASLDEGLIARRLIDVSFHLVAAPSLLAKFGRPKKLSDIAGAPFLAYTPVAANGRVRIGGGANKTELRFTPVLLSANETLLLHAAREGLGFAFMPHLVLGDDIAAGTLERVLPKDIGASVPLFAVYPKREYLPAKVRCFLDFLAGSDGFVRPSPRGRQRR